MPNIFLTLDYELYFSDDAGTQENAILRPTEKLLAVLDKYEVKASFFVDAGYLLRLSELKDKIPALQKDHEALTAQLRGLVRAGHDIQLHIHPHWEDSTFDGATWKMDTKRYRLHDFTEDEIADIVYRYKSVLADISKKPVFAFRAGGWCIQPFDKLRHALKENGVWLDSTVFKNGRNQSTTHYFDFRGAPDQSHWQFEEDPLTPETGGYFHELPIASLHVSPRFFWRLAFFKKLGGKWHQSFGDGAPAGGSAWDKLRMLTRPSHTVVSMDGFKASLLQKAFRQFQAKHKNKGNFVVIGHPKALTPYALDRLDRFLSQHRQASYLTYTDWARKNDLKRHGRQADQ